MYQWLEQELSEIRWKHFHVVDGPASEELRAAVENSPIPVPPSYRRFALRFGNAKLFQVLGMRFWTIGVFATPREVTLKKTGEDLLLVGKYGEVCVYFKVADLATGKGSPVYESGRNGFRRAGDTFDSWLRLRAERTRSRYKKHEWEKIRCGPDPFTEQELGVVQARRLFRWRVLGFSNNGDIRFEVTNGSCIRLAYLSIGIRAKDGRLDGGVWLPVASIAPGETAVVEKAAYKDLLDRSNVEVYSRPDPDPEDRERYWEFRTLSVKDYVSGRSR